MLGTIHSKPAIFIAERAAFPADPSYLAAFAPSLIHVKNNLFNDIYGSFLASTAASEHHDIKIDLIWPCTEQHIKKYSTQGLRIITETSQIYTEHVRPFMQEKREAGRLNWVYNILEGRKEQEDIIYREQGEEGFVAIPDLNWDRKTTTSLHVLAIVERRDIWSVRDLQKGHIIWLKHMREKLLNATCKIYPDVERDQLKLYFHCKLSLLHSFLTSLCYVAKPIVSLCLN